MIHIDGKAGKILILGDQKLKISTVKAIGKSVSITIPLVDIADVQIIEPGTFTAGVLSVYALGISYAIQYSKKFKETAHTIKKYIDAKSYTEAPKDKSCSDSSYLLKKENPLKFESSALPLSSRTIDTIPKSNLYPHSINTRSASRMKDNLLKAGLTPTYESIKQFTTDTILDCTEYIIYDCETTGLNQYSDKIIEVSAIHVKDGEVISEFSNLINPQTNIPQAATRINGITDSMVAHAPLIEDVLPDLLKFFSRFPIIGYSVSFDMGFLYAALPSEYKNTLNSVDALSIARRYLPDLENHKLETVMRHIKSSDYVQQHRGLGDCMAVYDLINYVIAIKNEQEMQAAEKFTEDEKLCFKLVCEILIKNNKDLSRVRGKKLSNYLDINVNAWGSMLRFKLSGKKKYLLVATGTQCEGFITEPGSKSEDCDRILVNQLADIEYLEKLICFLYDEEIDRYNDEKGSYKRYLRDFLCDTSALKHKACVG